MAGDGYGAVWARHLDLGVLDLDLRQWVNEGLMSIFFFVVGLEIKRELARGELRDRRVAALPVLAALGGVVVPALIFLALTAATPDTAGWAIPAATDIAFAVGVLALLGSRVAPGMRLLLLTIAVVDDIAAVLIIALFYGGGVHATIVAVALGLLTPARTVWGRDVLVILEQRLHPVSAFVVVPLFALANAGVSFGGGVLSDALHSRLAWAIAVALVVGKLAGITGATFAALRLRAGTLPAGTPHGQVWGVAAVGGIGFTVSLFIAQLAFNDAATVDLAKVGIFAGSLFSGLLGALLLVMRARRGSPRSRRSRRRG